MLFVDQHKENTFLEYKLFYLFFISSLLFQFDWGMFPIALLST